MPSLQRTSIRSAPFLPFLFTAGRVSLLQAVALAFPLAMDFFNRGPLLLPVFFTCLVVALAWESLFSFLRHADMSLHGLTTAMLVTLFVPLGIETWQLAVAVSLGVVLGELVFGGRGFGFVNPAAATLALLVFSFPQLALQSIDVTIALASIPSAVLLLLAGLISWRVLAATLVISAAAIALLGEFGSTQTLAIALSVGLVFLIADPLSAACTNPGRWAYGALAGFLIAVFSGFATADLTAEAVVFAALLASIFAPLLDHLAVLANAYVRENRREAHWKKRFGEKRNVERHGAERHNA